MYLPWISSKQMNGDDRGGVASCERNPMEQDDSRGDPVSRQVVCRVLYLHRMVSFLPRQEKIIKSLQIERDVTESKARGN
jgi:hypothetical protein